MIHKTVLLHESIDGLAIGEEKSSAGPAIIVDATINGGGHSEKMIELHGKDVRIVGIDLDEDALSRAQVRLDVANEMAEKAGKGKAVFSLHQSSFRNVDVVLREAGISEIDGILFDLGLSSNQFEDSGRGFSFQRDEPLLMTFKRNPDAEKGEITAHQVVNEWDEENIADIIYGYGEERYSRKIANRIVEARKKKPIATTFELVDIIRSGVPFLYTKGKTHFATKTFQALRIAANDEIQSLREGLKKGFSLLKTGDAKAGKIGGRMSVISFHSIEDRIVKRFFLEMHKEDKATIITKKPLAPSSEELKENRRARSAKLRILEKTTEFKKSDGYIKKE